MNNWYQLWSKAGATPNYRVSNPDEYIKFLNWVPNWFQSYFLVKVLDTLGIIFSIIFIFLFFLRRKKILKNTYNNYIVLYLFVIFFFILWFFNHPDLRYGGYVLLSSLFFIPISVYLSKFYHKKIIFNKFFTIITIFVILSFNLINFLRINSEFKRTDYYKYINFPFYHVENISYEEVILKDNIKVFFIKGGHCWATPSPCLTSVVSSKKFFNYEFFSK